MSCVMTLAYFQTRSYQWLYMHGATLLAELFSTSHLASIFRRFYFRSNSLALQQSIC
jgi:hypothetical protein